MPSVLKLYPIRMIFDLAFYESTFAYKNVLKDSLLDIFQYFPFASIVESVRQ